MARSVTIRVRSKVAPSGSSNSILKYPPIFHRQETGRNNAVNQHNSDQHHTKSTQNPARMLDRTSHSSHIFIATNTQPFINLPENDILFSFRYPASESMNTSPGSMSEPLP